jgi:fucose permease
MLASARSRQYAALIFMAFLNGWFVSCVGPLIPHFAKATNTEETDYAYLFMVRSIANVLGGILVKYLLNQLKVTPLMYIYLSVVVACLFISTLSLSTLNISITLFASSICLVGTAVITFGVTIKLFVTDRPDYFIQLIGFFFGVGAMCGPLFVYLFELENFKVLGLAHLTIILCFIKYPLPDLNSQQS